MIKFRKNKIKYSLVIFAIVYLFTIAKTNVNANTSYYENALGVSMTELEYNNIIAIHGEIFLDSIDQTMMEENIEFYTSTKLNTETITINDNEILNLARDTTHSTSYKTLSIVSTSINQNYKLITVSLTWKILPNIRSYDVIGVRLSNTTFSSEITSKMVTDNTSQTITDSQKYTNGNGTIIKLSSNCTSISVQQTFKVSTGGKVYASYQHSVKSISLSDATDFTISSSGLGGVLNFKNNNLFDGMAGVKISV